MVELSNERIEQILHEETKKTEDLKTILRSIYFRYMNLYEHYFADLDALNNDKIAEFRKQHEETKSLIKYYYMDIPQDICHEIHEFEEKVSDKLLGRDWKTHLNDIYEEYKANNKDWNKKEEDYKAEFPKAAIDAFYEAMESIFRDAFGTNSATAKDFIEGIGGLLLGKKD